MKNKRLEVVTGLLNGLVVVLAIAAWSQTQSMTVSIIDIAGLLALVAFSLMWVHYLTDAIREEWYPTQTIGIQYKITRWIVLGAIILHPALINLYLMQQGYGLPPNSYEQYLGGSYVPFVFLGWIALAAFLLFELKRQLKKRDWWRFALHFNIIAMFLVLIHGFQLGTVTQSGWYNIIWWLYTGSFCVVALRYYMQYYKSMKNRKYIAIFIIFCLTAVVVSVGLANRPVEKSSRDPVSQQEVYQEKPTATKPDPGDATSSVNIITTEQLSAQNGKNGANCWIAISGTVYDATDSPEWVDGEHVPSRGQASCGRDLTEAISQSPHGASVLAELPSVGKFE